MPEPVFLDRDGVLNENVPDYVRTPSQWKPLPGALEAAAVLSMAGHPVVVVTNQSAIGRGLVKAEAVEEINSMLCRRIAGYGGSVAGVYYCPHAPGEGCSCRKPLTGLVDSARQDLGLPPGGWLVGDAASDIELGTACGLRTILVLSGRGIEQLERMRSSGAADPDFVAGDLADAALIVLHGDPTAAGGG
jgi:D-glycero-D-manno-heptose 1,7-bisphosphate phosphatase